MTASDLLARYDGRGDAAGRRRGRAGRLRALEKPGRVAAQTAAAALATYGLFQIAGCRRRPGLSSRRCS